MSCPIHIGTAGWSIPSQHASLFPAEGTHLERYSQVFSCVEINSSFYRPHRPATYMRWAASTPEHFRFSVKAPKAITHQSGLVPERAQFQAFLDEIRHLGGKLGPILLQFPPRQILNELARGFFALFRDLYPNGDAVVEPRHASWFSPEADRLLEEFRLARVTADPSPVPGAVRPRYDAKLVYYRLHGSPRVYYSSYSERQIEQLAATLSTYRNTANAWCIFDNTALGAATENTLTLAHKLGQLR